MPSEDAAKQIEYARTLNEIARDDVRQVYLRVTGVLGLAVLFVTQLPFHRLVGLPLLARWALMAGVASAVASAALYFYYLSKLHLARLDIARSIRDEDGAGAENIWAGSGSVWSSYGWAFTYGGRLLYISVSLLGCTLGVLLNLIPG